MNLISSICENGGEQCFFVNNGIDATATYDSSILYSFIEVALFRCNYGVKSKVNNVY